MANKRPVITPEITVVAEMMKNFRELIGKTSPETIPSKRHCSGSSNTSVATRLQFDESHFQHSPVEISQKRKLDAEIAFNKCRISLLETEISNLKTSKKRDRIEYEANLEASKRAHEIEKEKREDIQHKMNCMLKQEKQVLEELKSLRAACRDQKLEHSQKMQSLMNEKLLVESKSSEEIAQLKEKLFDLEADYERVVLDLELCKNEMKEYCDQIDSFTSREGDATLRDQQFEELKSEKEQCDMKIMELMQQIARNEESVKVARVLQGEVANLKQLKNENKMLKEENKNLRMNEENIMLLKEQYEILHRAHERAEERCVALMQSQITNQDLQAKLKGWDSLKAFNAHKPHCPATLSKTISELQSKEAVHLENIGSLRSKLNGLEKSTKDLEKQVQVTKDEVEKKNLALKQKEDEARILRKKLLLISKERDFYREVNSQYENDMTMNKGMSLVNSDKIQHLENLVEYYKNHTDNLEANLHKKDDEITETITKLHDVEGNQHKTLMCELTEARSKVEQLESRCTQLESDKDALNLRLEFRALKGDYDPRDTKIVHFTANPLNEATERHEDELQSLMKENDRLKQRVQLLENAGHGAPVEDLTVAVERELQKIPSGKEVKEMQEQLALAELRGKTMMELFKKTSQELREAVYVLLGYQLDMPCHNRYKLSSMYAESQHDFLMFEQSPSGEFQLLETEYTKTIESLISLHLHHQHSIPAFLCSVTLDLFSRQTIDF